MAGTHTKFLVVLLLLINALVLFNIRRTGPDLTRELNISAEDTPESMEIGGGRGRGDGGGGGGGINYISGRENAAGDVANGGGVGAEERASGERQEERRKGSSSSSGREGSGRGGEGERGSEGGGLIYSAAVSAAPVVGDFPPTEPGKEGEGMGAGGENGSGGGGGVEDGGDWAAEMKELDPAEVVAVQTKEQRAPQLPAGGGLLQTEEERECNDMMKTLKIVPNKSWGSALKAQQQRWDLLGCNSVVEGAEQGIRDCTARPSTASDPLIAVCAGSTTRGVAAPDERSLALFRYLLPSLAATVDCGFRYVVVIGYDVGDAFFDGAAGRAKTLAWFETEVSAPAALRGLSIEIELLRVNNPIQKPGPVFTAITNAAYDLGADYFYRVNDDSEMHTPWARSFVDALEAMGPPYGVVGPDSYNHKILVHDFTHRLHMDIFGGQYYPASLTDWYVDDWISRVYGDGRTIRASNCRVEHHTGAHGQRYQADTTKVGSVNGLVTVGARKIAAWASTNGAEAAAREILSDSLRGKSATKAGARVIP